MTVVSRAIDPWDARPLPRPLKNGGNLRDQSALIFIISMLKLPWKPEELNVGYFRPHP